MHAHRYFGHCYSVNLSSDPYYCPAGGVCCSLEEEESWSLHDTVSSSLNLASSKFNGCITSTKNISNHMELKHTWTWT